MLNLTGYKAGDCIHESSHSRVFYGESISGNKPVIIKVLASSYPSSTDIAKIRREYDIARTLALDGVVRPDSIVPFGNSFALILEDFGGFSLESIIREGGLKLESFLDIFIKLSETLGKIHQQGVIHKDIKPGNIIVNMHTGEVKITDFRIASLLSGEHQEIAPPELIEGTLSYIAPEQTGRMNRGIDHHADLYSLGITMYEALTGTLPFRTIEPMDLLHAHIAAEPEPPVERDKTVPGVLSDMIMILLSKNAEDRYWSGFGLKYDLEECLTRLRATGDIRPFVLKQRDIPTFFHLTEKLYGREREMNKLQSSFDQVCGGESELLLVTGRPGIGKSVLITELQKPVATHKGYFAEGKCDQLKRDIPYFGITRAFQSLVRQLLAEGRERIVSWMEEIKTAVGPNGQVIIDVIPDVELIIGPQSPAVHLPPDQARNRFNVVLTSFAKVFATRHHPLVLFLDDLQWADSASLQLIETFLTDTGLRYFMLVGAYRSTEVGPSHPLQFALEEIVKAGVTPVEVNVGPLSVDGLIDMLNDTFVAYGPDVDRLAGLIMTKTQGNPFFIKAFLRTLHREGMLAFNTETSEWDWDISRINRAEITDNVVKMMCDKIRGFPEEEQETLKIAAAIGNRFSLDILSAAGGVKITDAAAGLWEIIREGIVEPVGGAYKYVDTETGGDDESDEAAGKLEYCFVHDRIQQAAYSLIEEERKKEIHLRIGRIILERVAEDERDEHIFDIVRHLYLGVELMDEEIERVALAGLELTACRRAREASAYAMSRQFAENGMDLISDNGWQSHYDLTRDLFMLRAESEYMTGNIERAENIIATTLEKIRTNEEKARVYDLKTVIYTLGDLTESVRAGLAGLRLLGIHIPENPGKLGVAVEFGKAFIRLRGRRPADLLSLPEMKDRKHKLAIRLIMNTISSVYLINQQLFEFLCLKGFNLTLQYGLTEASPYMLHTYAFPLADKFGAYKSAYDFGVTAFDLNKKYPNSQMRSKITCLFGFFFSHWRKPLKEGIDMVKRGFGYCVETGDFVFAGYSACTLVIYMFSQGRNIYDILKETETYEAVITRAENQFAIDWYMLKSQLIRNLKGGTKDVLSFSDRQYDEEKAVQGFKEQQNANLLFHYYLWKGLILYLQGEFEEAYRMLNEGKTQRHGVALLPSIGDHLFYHSLVMTALYPRLSGGEFSRLRTALKKNVEQLKKWADNCPESFQHKYLLVAAEISKLKGRTVRAADLFDKSIAGAGAGGFIHHEAMANERAAVFYAELGRGRTAATYMTEAQYLYSLWGADSKVSQLENSYPELIGEYVRKYKTGDMKKEEESTGLKDMLTTEDDRRIVDLLSVVRASHEISGEVELPKLLERLIHIVIANAGARRGILIAVENGKLIVRAEGEVNPHRKETDNDSIVVRIKAEAVEEREDLLTPVINYVNRTMEDIVLDDAANKGDFVSDPYVLKHSPRSVLCLPVTRQSKLVAILYLENNMASGAFTVDRIEVLKLLASQAAISLENAKLYDDIEQRVVQLQEAEGRIKTSLKEKEVLLREIHHRVKNNMQIISSLLNLQSTQISNKEYLATLEDSQSRIKAMSLIHEKLYRSEDLSSINFSDYISDLTRSIFRTYGSSAGGVDLKIEADDILLGIDTAIPCGLIINELVSNAIKHAFPEGRKGEVKIALKKTTAGEIEMRVIDNGAGIPADIDFNTTESLGLRLVNALSKEQLQGNIELNENGGTEFRIRFKDLGYEKRL